jgi:uncharacterized protein Yka (UPF0111/DUF47 family)
VGVVNRGRWFLPESPDVLAMLAQQMDATRLGMAALAGWAHGDGEQEGALRDAEHLADAHKRELRRALRTAFTTQLEPEDLFTLSEGLDDILNGAKDLVREADVMAMAPDPPLAEMADLLVVGVAHLESAFVRLGRRGEDATGEADLAVKCQRRMERVYRRAMSGLIDCDDLRMVMGRRELYRRMSRLGDGLVHVAERVWYATVKEA